MSLNNKYSQLVDELNGDLENLNDNLTNVISESALEVGGKALKVSSGKNSQQPPRT